MTKKEALKLLILFAFLSPIAIGAGFLGKKIPENYEFLAILAVIPAFIVGALLAKRLKIKRNPKAAIASIAIMFIAMIIYITVTGQWQSPRWLD